MSHDLAAMCRQTNDESHFDALIVNDHSRSLQHLLSWDVNLQLSAFPAGPSGAFELLIKPPFSAHFV